MGTPGLLDWRHVLRLRVQARRTGRLRLRVRQGHRSKHEHGGSESHGDFSHLNSSSMALNGKFELPTLTHRPQRRAKRPGC
jgi:hypothetical protein